jgi:hypothetical protein
MHSGSLFSDKEIYHMYQIILNIILSVDEELNIQCRYILLTKKQVTGKIEHLPVTFYEYNLLLYADGYFSNIIFLIELKLPASGR